MDVDRDETCRLERAAVAAWPATVQERTADGWLLRATPGLSRGRSNNALTPCRELAAHELAPAIARVEAFSRRHGIQPGIQVSPVELHAPLQAELDRRGWATRWPVLVLVRRPTTATEPGELALELADRATPEWLRAWGRCEQRDENEVRAHAETVFSRLAGRACFARVGQRAVGISVPAEGATGLFCVAVSPEHRREGLGTALVRELLRRAAERTVFLQVEERNQPAIALYERLGFEQAYRYCHRLAQPVG